MTLILAVDDELETLGSIRRVLQDADYKVVTANSGYEALEILTSEQPELAILDVMMPEMTGIELCKRIRANPFSARLPIIFLTAKSRPTNIVEGLDAGGDDYIIKPFQVVELPARIRALLRRSPSGLLGSDSDHISVGHMQLHTKQLTLHIDKQSYELTAVEHRLLYNLLTNIGQPQSVEQLLKHVWEYPAGTGDPALVYAHIKNLRKKIEPQPDAPIYIQNIRRQGYLITP